MEDKIEVGEYIRLARCQGINKIIDETDCEYILHKYIADEWGDETDRLYKNESLKDEIVKHSKNIIDLIEVGDYVNGYYVERVWEQVNYRMAIDLRGSTLGLVDASHIRDIVTHEQFENVEYKVKE